MMQSLGNPTGRTRRAAEQRRKNADGEEQPELSQLLPRHTNCDWIFNLNPTGRRDKQYGLRGTEGHSALSQMFQNSRQSIFQTAVRMPPQPLQPLKSPNPLTASPERISGGWLFSCPGSRQAGPHWSMPLHRMVNPQIRTHAPAGICEACVTMLGESDATMTRGSGRRNSRSSPQIPHPPKDGAFEAAESCQACWNAGKGGVKFWTSQVRS